MSDFEELVNFRNFRNFRSISYFYKYRVYLYYLLLTLASSNYGGYIFEKRWFDRHAFDKAVQKAGIVDFKFHDLRHCAINNLRLAGNDHFKIKKASGHKTDIAFQRYNLVTEEEMVGMKWLDLKNDKHSTMDTYMDTKAIS